MQAATEAFKAQQQTQSNIRVEYVFIPCDGSVVTGVDDIGCEGHKNRLGQERVADFLEPRLRAIMGWNQTSSSLDHEIATTSYAATQEVVVRSVSSWSVHGCCMAAAAALLSLTAVVLARRRRRRRLSKKNPRYYKKYSTVNVEDDEEGDSVEFV